MGFRVQDLEFRVWGLGFRVRCVSQTPDNIGQAFLLVYQTVALPPGLLKCRTSDHLGSHLSGFRVGAQMDSYRYFGTKFPTT